MREVRSRLGQRDREREREREREMSVSFQTRGNMSVITKSSEREVIAIFPHNKYLLITTTMINFHIYIYIYIYIEREREREREREDPINTFIKLSHVLHGVPTSNI